MSRASRIGAYFVAIAIGAVAIIFGESDDSPGLQGLGLILLIYSIYKVIRIIDQRRGRQAHE